MNFVLKRMNFALKMMCFQPGFVTGGELWDYPRTCHRLHERGGTYSTLLLKWPLFIAVFYWKRGHFILKQIHPQFGAHAINFGAGVGSNEKIMTLDRKLTFFGSETDDFRLKSMMFGWKMMGYCISTGRLSDLQFWSAHGSRPECDQPKRWEHVILNAEFINFNTKSIVFYNNGGLSWEFHGKKLRFHTQKWRSFRNDAQKSRCCRTTPLLRPAEMSPPSSAVRLIHHLNAKFTIF